MAQQLLYKVLKGGQSIHGGDLTWSLPTQQPDGAWAPGDWHEVTGEITVCFRGLHLTTEPQRWMQSGATVYLAEGAGSSQAADDKIAFARARLLRPLTDDELAALRIFVSGAHSVNDGMTWASDNATVRASDSATVEAWDSTTVEAWDSTTVEASDSATVRASDSATVRASGSATVRASGSATVEAWDNATVRASDSATVEASGSATVEAWGSAVVTLTHWFTGPAPILTDNAVCIDRRVSPPRISVGGVAYVPEVAA